MNSKMLAAPCVVLLTVILTACSVAATPTIVGVSPAAASPSPAKTLSPTPTGAPLPSPTTSAITEATCSAVGMDFDPASGYCISLPTDPPDGPSTTALGETVGITCDGDACMDVTVAKVAFATRYRDPDRSYPIDDTPDHKGDVFMAVYVKYKATGQNADYNPLDWGVYVDDNAVDDYSYVSHGPTPEFHSGDLPEGKTAQGWIVYEVAKAGKVTIIFQPTGSAIFEVTLRSK